VSEVSVVEDAKMNPRDWEKSHSPAKENAFGERPSGKEQELGKME